MLNNVFKVLLGVHVRWYQFALYKSFLDYVLP